MYDGGRCNRMLLLFVVTDNLQSCMNHAVEAHEENIKGERCFVFLSKTLLVLLKIGSKIR